MNHNKKKNTVFRLILGLSMLMICFTACSDGPRSDDASSTSSGKKDTTTSRVTEPAAQHEPLSNVEAIQRAYNTTVTELERGALDSTSFTYSCKEEKKGTVTYFSEHGKLRLIVHRYSEYDHFSAEDRFFVRDSTVFFTYNKTVTWAFEDGSEGATKDNITEKRVYLVKDQPIKCLEKKFTIRSKATDNPRAEAVPSRNINCPSGEVVLKPYRMLTMFRNKPTTDCLE